MCRADTPQELRRAYRIVAREGVGCGGSVEFRSDRRKREARDRRIGVFVRPSRSLAPKTAAIGSPPHAASPEKLAKPSANIDRGRALISLHVGDGRACFPFGNRHEWQSDFRPTSPNGKLQLSRLSLASAVGGSLWHQPRVPARSSLVARDVKTITVDARKRSGRAPL